MSDIHALSGAYAVDAVDDIERASFERHLADCPTCRAEVASLRATTAALADDSAVTPPAALRSAVLDGITRVRPLPPLTAGGPVHRRKWFPALVAAVVLALVGVTGAIWQPWNDDSSQTLSATDRVLADKSAQRFSQDIPGGGSVTLVRSVKLHRAVLVAEDMPPAPKGKTYQLWLQSPEQVMEPAGLMDSDQRTALLDGDADVAIGAGITVEPNGGSDAPTSDPVVLFDFSEAA
jgi:Anti-sigma-K factor rskA/Putative zinc-finger